MDLQSRAVRRLTRIMAWTCLGYIAFVTVGPIWVRPETGASPQLERLVAFAVVGALFAAAYPRHIVLASLVVIGAAILLEAFQLLEASRHGRLFDASVKIVGGLIGLGTGWVFARLTQRSA
jgi:apolipoprotein N-acyltransferase